MYFQSNNQLQRVGELVKLVAGVDSSTQSCKVELRNLESGELIGISSAPHPPTFPPKSEQNPQAWWLAFVYAFEKVCQDARVNKEEIVGIAVAAQCHGLVSLDSENCPVRPAKLWNDTESANQSSDLVKEYSNEYWINTIGSTLVPSFTITKLAWLKANEPENFAKAKFFCLPQDYLTLCLSGHLVTDRAGATCTGYYSIKNKCWDFSVLKTLDSKREWESCLPKVLEPEKPAGLISRDAANALGLSADVIVGAGTGDQMASSLGLGVEVGDYVFAIGTSAVVFTIANNAIRDMGGLVNGIADASGHYMPVMVNLNGTKITDWAKSFLGCSHDDLADMALSIDSAKNPLSLSAYFDGERTPNLPFATGTLGGITHQTTREHFARTSFDGVLIPLINNFNYLSKLVGIEAERIILTGGAARNKAYGQLLADMVGREIFILDVDESSARGACVQAAAVASHRKVSEVLKEWRPKVKTICYPRDNRDYAAYFERQIACSNWRGLDRVEQREKI
jgi:xylulokinase